MSSLTANYSLVKPDLLEEADALVLTSNMQNASYALNRVKQSTASEYAKKLVSAQYKASGTTGVASSDTAWTVISSTWTSKFEASNGQLGESGSVVFNSSNTGTFAFIQPGYYRVNFQIAINLTGTLHTRGSMRAGIFYWDTTNTSYASGIPNTFVSGPLDTQAGIGTLTLDTIVKIAEQNSTGTKDAFVHASNLNTTFTTSGTPDWSWELRFGQHNTSSYTASILANDTWVNFEFVRPL